MSATQTACREILAKPNEAKAALYTQLATDLIKSKDCASLYAYVEHLVQREGADQYGRTYIVPSALNQLIGSLADESLPDPIDLEDLLPLLQKIVDLLRPRAESYPEQLMRSLKFLSEAHQGMEDFRAAAQALNSFRFEDYMSQGSSEAWQSAANRVAWYVSSAELWLSVDETGSASQQIKRAHALISELPKTDVKLILRFRTCYARVLDAERKFQEAAQRYLELSHLAVGLVNENDVMQTLQLAVNCALLAKPSPGRSRVLAALHSDERVRGLPNRAMLESMFYERLIRPSEVAEFESLLAPHQKADTSTGLTVVKNSMIEHNIAAASKIYRNVKWSELSRMLGVGEAEAESITARMIEQGRLEAAIDQVEGICEFKSSNQGNNQSINRAGSSSAEALQSWDHEIEEVCLQINRISDSIQRQFPQFVES